MAAINVGWCVFHTHTKRNNDEQLLNMCRIVKQLSLCYRNIHVAL